VAAFSAIGNVAESVTYRSKTSNPTYTPSTGAVTDGYTDYTVSMVFTKITDNELLKENVQLDDMWALIPASNLTPTPKLNDEIVRDSSTWNIRMIKTDPTEALWKFLIRQG